MREIVLDTETTGFYPDKGDRIVEIGAVELYGHVPTGRTFHEYINPQRPMPEDAFKVHGLGDAFLKDKPVFEEVVDGFLSFILDSPIVIHNAEFDTRFLNSELTRAGRTSIRSDRVIDTLAIARRRFPGSPASLDALCRRFGIDSSARTLHGALLDSEILAEVYLELIGGRQPDFALVPQERPAARLETDDWKPAPRKARLASRLTHSERVAHENFVATLGEAAVWATYDPSVPGEAGVPADCESA